MLVVALVLVRLLNLVGLLSIAGCGLCVEPIELFLRVCLCIVIVIVIVINISIAIDGDIVIVIMVVCTMQTAQNSIAG